MIFRPKSLIFVRHAESVWNALSQGQRGTVKEMPAGLKNMPDYKTPLTENGIAQAIKTGAELLKQFGEFETIYHSPWVRTTKTTELLLNSFPKKTQGKMRKRCFRNLFLIEQQFGDLDLGISECTDLQKKYNEFYERRKIAGKFYLRPPNGESWWDVCMRTHTFLDIIFRPNRHGQRLLIVSHGVAIQTFRYHLERLGEDEVVELYQHDKCKNCGVSWYEWNPNLGSRGRYELRFWNKTFY
ncbi:MAG: histidine phosphatase family protein [Candidatus Yanofskybacteria bacterium]|nr:histidine phosphatase family protein [Candidatus Yanofskybacteria bacterium]